MVDVVVVVVGIVSGEVGSGDPREGSEEREGGRERKMRVGINETGGWGRVGGVEWWRSGGVVERGERRRGGGEREGGERREGWRALSQITKRRDPERGLDVHRYIDAH